MQLRFDRAAQLVLASVQAHPGTNPDKIATETGLSRPVVRAQLEGLEAAGLTGPRHAMMTGIPSGPVGDRLSAVAARDAVRAIYNVAAEASVMFHLASTTGDALHAEADAIASLLGLRSWWLTPVAPFAAST